MVADPAGVQRQLPPAISLPITTPTCLSIYFYQLPVSTDCNSGSQSRRPESGIFRQMNGGAFHTDIKRVKAQLCQYLVRPAGLAGE